jgi:uncharacterized membrane protein YkoI
VKSNARVLRPAQARRRGPALALSLALVLAQALPASARPEKARGPLWRGLPAAMSEVEVAQNQQLVPLEQVIQRLRQRYSGDRLDARIVERPGAVVYEIKWLTAEGRKLVIVVDAGTGAVLRTEGMP